MSSDMSGFPLWGGMPDILVKETSLKVKEVKSHGEPLVWAPTAEATASALMTGLVPKGKTYPTPVYGQNVALYTTTGVIIPATASVAPGDYLLATSLPVESIPGTLAPKTPIKTEYQKTGEGKLLQKTIYDDGTSDVFVVNVQSVVKTTPTARPRAKNLFDTREMPRDQWAWMVEARRLMRLKNFDGGVEKTVDIWGDFKKNQRDPPYGFGDRVSALRRMVSVMKTDAHNVGLGLVEYRVVPHYLGYRPVDEPWYAAEWRPPLPFPDSSSIPPR